VRNFITWLAVGFLFPVVAFGGTIQVTLDAPPVLLQAHSTTLLFGIKYTDGTDSATELFSQAEMQAGTTSKTFFIDDTKTVASCEYQWGIMDKPPVLSGHPVVTAPPLWFPVSLNGALDFKNNCTVDASTKTLVLDLGPWKLQRIEIDAHRSALLSHNARMLFANFSLAGANDSYPSQSLTLLAQSPDPTIFTADVMVREAVTVNVDEMWVNGDGSRTDDAIHSPDFHVDIH